MITIYHNPRCGKSRECLAFLENSEKEFEVVKYLDVHFTFKTLSNLINKLNINPIELVRTKEKIWIEKFKNETLSNDQIITAMVLHPVLVERPIAVNGNKAVIARPFERIKSIV
ncbi:arsenate reductase (glutaredoxin) [Flavobacterium sp.]|uniref:arsenate reductase (glutaredoxin) n=1 Tax=Flavobacterium sp. TaxID=239 RepID=UPI0037505986